MIVAFGVSISGLALARNPPALVKQQAAAANATQSSGGYRDINARFGVVPARTPTVMRSAGGYRDMNHRFGAPPSVDNFATCATPSRAC